jgi:FlaA1/EpsC-like NDP-sugar epimerase
MDGNPLIGDLAAFAESHRLKLAEWRRKLGQLREQGRSAVVWGAGSKGVTFLNAVQAGDLIHYVVDLNPRKHGRFIAGAGQEIVPPHFLKGRPVDVIILMNPVYEKEVRELVSSLDLHPEFLLA